MKVLAERVCGFTTERRGKGAEGVMRLSREVMTCVRGRRPEEILWRDSPDKPQFSLGKSLHLELPTTEDMGGL